MEAHSMEHRSVQSGMQTAASSPVASCVMVTLSVQVSWHSQGHKAEPPHPSGIAPAHRCVHCAGVHAVVVDVEVVVEVVDGSGAVLVVEPEEVTTVVVPVTGMAGPAVIPLIRRMRWPKVSVT